jgi:hypothetical protein
MLSSMTDQQDQPLADDAGQFDADDLEHELEEPDEEAAPVAVGESGPGTLEVLVDDDGEA